MYSRSLACLCRRQCCKHQPPTTNYIYDNHYSYLLYTNHHHYISHATSNKHNRHNQLNLTFPIRCFASKQTENTNTKTTTEHDDSYLDLDEEQQPEQEQESSKSRKWKSSQTKRGQRMDKIDSPSTSEPAIKPSKWSSIKSVINKPFAAIKAKTSRKKKTDDSESETKTKTIKKEKLVHRPGKKSLPSPGEGIMTFIPKHKAQILHILQEECNIFPDEVFPLFPDHKTEEILADAEDWTGESIKFVDDEQTKKLITAQDDTSEEEDSESDEDEQRYIDPDQHGKKKQLLLQQTEKSKSDSLIIPKKTPLSQLKAEKRIETLSIAELMSDKPKTTASKLRDHKVSGIDVDDERSKFREMSVMNPYKYRRIMTPQQVKQLYADEIGDKKGEDEDEDALDVDGADIWAQDADNVYEIVQLLRELGFKTNQNSAVWPYTEFMKSEMEMSGDVDTGKEGDDGSGETAVVLHEGSGLNPIADTFNDFYLLFARFPEILSMELNDIRRKLHVLEQFQIDDIRILLLKDPRILRRPSHHIRWLLEVFDDYFIDDFTQIIELSPHFLASTSKKEMVKRLCFIHKEILQPYQEYNNEIDKESVYRNMQIELKHLHKNSEFIIKHGVAIQKDKNLENDMINGVYLDDLDKENLSNFIIKHVDFIGNANVNRMCEIKGLLKKLGIKNKKLNDLLYEYPQILTISPQALHECVHQIKINGIRDYRQYFIDNIHDVLTYCSPIDSVVTTHHQQLETLQQ